MIRLCRLLAALLVIPAVARSEDLNVVFSCPLAANPPDSPSNPQVIVQKGNGWGYAQPTGDCRIAYANASGGELKNVEFVIDFGKTPAFTLADPTRLPNGDTNWVRRNRGATPISSHAGMPTVVGLGTPAGFPTGTAVTINGGAGYKWTIASIPAGATNELRVTHQFEMYSQKFTIPWTLTAKSTTTPFSMSDKVVNFTSNWDANHLTVRTSTSLKMPNAGDLYGYALVSTPNGWGAYPNTQLTMYLPYYDAGTATYKADENYSAANANHKLIYDDTDLEVAVADWVSLYDYRYLFRKNIASLTAPTSGSNANQVVQQIAGTNRVIVNIGWLPQGTNIDSGWYAYWSAKRSAAHTAVWANNTVIPTLKACATADGVTTPVCTPQTTTIVAEDAEVIEGTAFNVNFVSGYGAESAAFQPEQDFQTQLNIYPPAYKDLSNVDAYVQIAGDASGPQSVFTGASLSAGSVAAGGSIYVSTAASTYGNEDNLANRTVPSASATWVQCKNASNVPVENCTSTIVTALGITPSAVREVRFSFPAMRRRGIDGFGNPIGYVNQTLLPTARSSFDSSVFNRRDMRKASVGLAGKLVYTIGGVTKTVVSTWNGEVDARSRYGGSFGVQSPIVAAFNGNWWGGATATTEAQAAFSCGFINTGPANINGPVTVEMEMPLGFEISSVPVGYFPQVSNFNSVSWGPRPNITTPSLYTYTYDPTTRIAKGVFDLAGQGGVLAKALTSGAASESAMRGVMLTPVGTIVAGAPRQIVAKCKATANVANADGTRANITVTGNPYFDVTSVAPALQLTGTVTPAVVAGWDTYTQTITLDNAAYLANGTKRTNGATASARNSVLYERITRPGDYINVENGTARASFVAAASPDALSIWVNTAENPTRGSSSNVTTANGWKQCVAVGLTCDAAALAAIGITDLGTVRWVAYLLGEVLVTDAEPRGVAPRQGRTRDNKVYSATLRLADAGSSQNAIIRAVAEVSTSDATTAFSTESALDARVLATCDTRNPVLGFTKPEICDGLDNDCDGDTDEGFEDVGLNCSVGIGACKRDGERICAPSKLSTTCNVTAGTPVDEICDGLDNDCDDSTDENWPLLAQACTVAYDACKAPGVNVCNAAKTGLRCKLDEPADTDSDSVPDVCDCAPGESAYFTLVSNTSGSCDTDGDGWCNAAITKASTKLCPQSGDCDDRAASVHPTATERCNGVDDNCVDGKDETFTDLTDTCFEGTGECKRGGVRICAADGLATVCDAVPGTPVAEICNGLDDDCDDATDEDFPAFGQACTVRYGTCDAAGTSVCTADGAGTSCKLTTPEDADSDGFPDVCDCALGDPTRFTMLPAVSGSCDADGDGYCAAAIATPKDTLCVKTGDCADTDDSRHPGAAERCNLLDDDCSGKADESFADLDDACSNGTGACKKDGVRVCATDLAGTICDAKEGTPQAEKCNAIDDDCDGDTDEDFPTLTTACTLGIGACAAPGTWVCSTDGSGVTCNATPGAAGVEICNGLDDDCDGETDEGDDIRCNPDDYIRTGGGLATRFGCDSAGASGSMILLGLFALGWRRRRVMRSQSLSGR